MKTIKDMMGVPLEVGQYVAKATKHGTITIRTISKIDGSKVFLDDSHVALHYPGDLLVVDALFKPT